MTLPVRHGMGRPAERRFRGWRDPLAEFDDLYGRIGNLLESTVGGTMGAEAWAPLADLSETDDAYVVECDLPGVKRDAIDIEISERELSVTGESAEREGEGTLRSGTRRTGRFEYRMLMPGDVDAEGVTAALKEGVLTVTVPKARTSKPRHIEITGGD